MNSERHGPMLVLSSRHEGAVKNAYHVWIFDAYMILPYWQKIQKKIRKKRQSQKRGNPPHKKIIRTLYVDNFILVCVRHAKALRATLSPT